MAHPFIPVPNTALIEMVYTYGTQTIENTFHVQKGSPFTALELQGLTSVFDNWDGVGVGRFQLLRPFSSALQQIKARALDTASSPVWIYVLPVARIGGISGGADLPGNVTFAITWQSGLAGRSQRGRFYMPGINSGKLQSTPNLNDLQAAYANSLVTCANALIAAVAGAGAGYHLVVTSYMSGGVWRSTGVNTVIANAAYADLHIDSQRRRLSGRGR